MFKPTEINQLRTAVILLTPTYSKYNGVQKKSYPDTGEKIFVNWKSRGGTESVVNGVLSIIDTATVTTWFRPDITSGCRLKREDGAIYEIKGEPENIELANKYLVFTVERVKGGV